jgi:hypothetical protein
MKKDHAGLDVVMGHSGGVVGPAIGAVAHMASADEMINKLAGANT